MEKIHDAFGRVGKHIAPHTLVRRWDTALLFGAGVFLAAYLIGIAILRIGDVYYSVPYVLHLQVGIYSGIHYATLGTFLRDVSPQTVEVLRMTQHFYSTLACFYISIALGLWATKYGLKPRRNMYVLDGPQLLKGKSAEQEAKRITKIEVQDSAMPLLLHPLLRLSQERWNRHMLIYGSVGSGKTQVLLPIIRQVIYKRKKLLLYDVKGDFTSYGDFSAATYIDPTWTRAQRAQAALCKAVFPRPIIVSPYDRQGYVWDVACDVNTNVQIEEFARCLIPQSPGESNPFFTNTARMILVGSLRTLVANMGKTWGWPVFDAQLNKTAEQMKPDILANYKKAFPLIENTESQTTASIMSTIMANMQAIEYMAKAWPKVGKRRFSIVEWAQDDYKGRRGVIVQGGGMEVLTSSYISALINILVGEVISPKMTENKDRGIYIVLDELTSAGWLNIGPLIDKGRSKGVTLIAGIQELGQLAKVYSQEDAKIIPTIVGTHVICQLQMSETRKQVADMFGTNVTATLAHDEQANVHQDGRQVVFEHQLTNELGPRKTKNGGFEVRAIVATAGYDPLLLAFPGQSLEKQRPGQVPAKWMTEAAAVKAEVQEPYVEPEAVADGGLEVSAHQSQIMSQQELYELFR
ncbi:type IV secretion system DNA-binding domain-containing protein [uncultured Stenotrophomonas sp.]|uniref:type IV secretion system DNA-binding domain-containing protein n=1 Tax=uncultured Stenotrophomonas sp. TaxID=165438 RepID=UPI0028D12DF7|nr:type IV secretion system DNA-binding domain-containing protein [uncultured Stenotrophomonas sp.]